MIFLAHISDLHFGRTNPQVVDGLRNKLESLAPDHIIISGDLTQRAKEKEYLEARQFLDTLSSPFLVIPGNHDISATKLFERFIYPWRKWHKHIKTPLEIKFADKKTIFAGINTARRFHLSLDWSRGDISSSQLDHIQSVVASPEEEKLKILVAHHPFWLPRRFEKRHIIYGRDQALQRFQGVGPDIILSGHIHVPFIRVLDGIVVSHAGTACSTRLVEGNPNSFNIIRGNSSRLKIQAYKWSGQEFEPEPPRCFTRSDGCWQEKQPPA